MEFLPTTTNTGPDVTYFYWVWSQNDAFWTSVDGISIEINMISI